MSADAVASAFGKKIKKKPPMVDRSGKREVGGRL
jgi:hypothetical protein